MRSGFGAEELDLQECRLMRGPEAFDLHRLAVVEADQPGSIVVGGVLARDFRRLRLEVPVARAAWPKPGARDAAHRYRPGHAHQPPGRVKHVHAHVAESAAAF